MANGLRRRDSTKPQEIIIFDGSYLPRVPFVGWSPPDERVVRQYYPYQVGPVNQWGFGDYTLYPHDGRVNVLFHGGHVGSFDPQAFVPVWEAGYSLRQTN